MLIDWFTVGAQLLNFVVLVWLMQRFLYRPVLAAIDARERQVAATLADADAKQADARRERDALDAKNAAFDQERAALWAKAGDAAEAERRRLLDDAAQAAEAASVKRHDAIRDEAAGLSRSVGERAQQEVFAIVRRTLAELADATLEARVCAVFVQRLRTLDAGARDALAGAIRAEAGPVRVRSAFELAEAERATVRQAVADTFATDAQLVFETAPALVAGIELGVGGQRLDWSIGGQVAALAGQVAGWVAPPQAVEAKAEAAVPATPAAPAPEAPKPARPHEAVVA